MRSARTTLGGICIAFAVMSLSLTARAGENEFTATTVHQAPGPIYGLVSGEFDASHAGDEIAFLLGDGTVLELAREGDAWFSTLLAPSTFLIPISDMTWRPTISIGDVHSGYAGNEIIVQGGRALVSVFFDQDTGWSQEPVVDLSDLFGSGWGARVGNLDPSCPGDEIFYIHEGVADFSFGNMYRESSGTWQLGAEILYSAEVGMDSAIGDINPDHPGNELLIVTEMGPAYELFPPADPADTPWPVRLIWNDFDDSGWVVKIADVDPGTPGREVIYGTRYSNRIMLSRHNGPDEHQPEILLTGISGELQNKNMWDIATGDVFPESAALEIMGVDDSGTVYLVHREADGWQGEIVWPGSGEPLFAVVSGDFAPDRSGDEILVAGAAGTVTLLTPRTVSACADLNGDGAVGPADLAILLGGWGPCDGCPADLNGDNMIDAADLAQLLGSWGPCA